MIEIPIGDLMNPVYNTLNELQTYFGQPPSFPTDLQNERIPFLREEEHETKIRVVQPLIQPAIYYNYRIQKKLKQMKDVELSLFKRHLIVDIKTAYFNYLKTDQVVKIYQRTIELLTENLRVSEKLFQNGKATEEVVFRSKAELSELEQKLTEAVKNEKLAAAYFNFLINRPLQSSIEILMMFYWNTTMR